MSNKLTLIASAIMLPLTISVNGSVINQTKGDFEDKFRQLVQHFQHLMFLEMQQANLARNTGNKR